MQVRLRVNTMIPNMLWRIRNKLTVRIKLVSKTISYAYRILKNYPQMEVKMMKDSKN
jgi:hypothetical protein